jgi:hypothetical protein
VGAQATLFQGIFPWVGGLVVSTFGYGPVWGAVAVATLLSALLLLTWVREPAPSLA